MKLDLSAKLIFCAVKLNINVTPVIQASVCSLVVNLVLVHTKQASGSYYGTFDPQAVKVTAK